MPPTFRILFKNKYTVIYSGLRQLPKFIFDSKKADISFIFAWADKRIYELVRAVSAICPHVWVVLVQKPDDAFFALTARQQLECSYLYIFDKDVKGLRVADGRALRRFSFGINSGKYVPAAEENVAALPDVIAGKSPVSLLRHTGSWNDTAAEILRIVSEEG